MDEDVYTVDWNRALATATERKQIGGVGDYTENQQHQGASRVRRRVREELPKDIEVLKEHHPELLQEVRGIVCNTD